MPPARLVPPTRLALALVLVVGVALGCSAASTPLPSPVPVAVRPSPAKQSASSSPMAAPPHRVVTGPSVAGAFDLVTDGIVIAWSSGAVDVDAPALWSLDPATRQASLVYRSATPGAILANLAVRNGTFAFAEVTTRASGSRTWRLVLLDASGRARVIDTNDLAEAQTGTLPMAAISELGVLWATSHAGDPTTLRCELRYASLADLRPRLVASQPCSRTEFWYPRSDGRRFVYGTVEYPAGGGADERHVYLVDDAQPVDLGQPRRLDLDGQASLPSISGDAIIWKAAPRDLNMFNPGGLVELDLSTAGVPRPIEFRSSVAPQLTTPSIGPRFIAGEDATGGSVTAWDRDRSTALEVDRLSSTDPGFISGTRLAGGLLAWFYTSSAQGGGIREIRGISLPAGHA